MPRWHPLPTSKFQGPISSCPYLYLFYLTSHLYHSSAISNLKIPASAAYLNTSRHWPIHPVADHSWSPPQITHSHTWTGGLTPPPKIGRSQTTLPPQTAGARQLATNQRQPAQGANTAPAEIQGGPKILTYLPYLGRTNLQFPSTGYLLTYKITTINMNIHKIQSANTINQDKSHAVINIIQCHLHTLHEITNSYTGKVQYTYTYTHHTQYAY